MIEQRDNRPALLAIRPLVVGIDPQPGECLSSVLVRACEANVFTKTSQLLDLIGIRTKASEAVPFTGANAAPAIARLLGTAIDEIESRMHPARPDECGRSIANWFGGRIERRHLEATVRRFAPRSLEQSENSPALWSVRLLDYCPVTMEHLLSACPKCSRTLGWRACRSLIKCDICGSSLLPAHSLTMAPHLRDAARHAAALVSPIGSERQVALSALPDPFRTWNHSDALAGLLTLGEAQLSLEASDNSSATAGSAACFRAGLEFAQQWPESLSRYVKASTDRKNSTSVRTGLGPLGRLFESSAKRTPIRDLVRAAIPTSLGEAIVPAKLHPGVLANGACRAGMLTALEAANRLGISLEHLRRLEGRSQAFLARHNVKGGVVLYDEAAIDRLADALSISTSYRDAARMLGVPRYCVDALATAGLVAAVNNHDAMVVTGGPLIARASIVALRVRLQRHSMVLTGGQTLRKAMQRIGDPNDWVIVLQKALAGQIPIHIAEAEGRAISENIIVQSADVTRHVARRSEGPGISGIDIPCQQAAEIIGTTTQFVSAAVKAGFLEGESGVRNFAIPLERVLQFQRRFVLTDEIRETFGAHQKSVGAQFLRAGLKPAATINRVKVWRRSDIEMFVESRRDLANQSD